MSFEHKLVAVINKKIEIGVAFNALAHMTLGLGASMDKEKLRLDNYVDAEERIYPNISQMPFIILKAKSGEIRKLALLAQEKNIEHGVFTETMTGGTYQEQLARTRASNAQDMDFYGVVMFGPWDDVTALTRKFSLYQ